MSSTGLERIASYLRGRITAGRIAPGDRLPTHEKLQEQFDTTRVTVQRALDRLVAEGFVRTTPKIGRFVADRLPHLSRYALIFESRPESRGVWSRYHSAIIAASDGLARRRGISFGIYFDVNGHVDSEGFQQLVRDVEIRRLAGLIFSFSPVNLVGSSLLERNDPPRTVGANVRLGLPVWAHANETFFPRALDALLADGRRRVAVITKPTIGEEWMRQFESCVAARGMTSLPFWTQAVDPHETRWVRHALHAILNSHADLVPDALIVTDDHLVEAVADALPEFGVSRQIRVIGHWNFPLEYRGRTPVDLLGYDNRELLRRWVDNVDAQRRGESVPRYGIVPARFASELLPENDDIAGERAAGAAAGEALLRASNFDLGEAAEKKQWPVSMESILSAP